ncbi:hypothetical protein [Leptothermofonsia sp. ETS-13]|uniref:hypothetical protein n=1 Tax=Leptothermofonsia sp. ETS-13 TaxID=3035696 RepID=UPI003B9DFFCA
MDKQLNGLGANLCTDTHDPAQDFAQDAQDTAHFDAQPAQIVEAEIVESQITII